MKRLKVDKFVIDHVVRMASMEVEVSDNIYTALTEDECNEFVTKVIEGADETDDLVWKDLEKRETEDLEEVTFEEMTRPLAVSNETQKAGLARRLFLWAIDFQTYQVLHLKETTSCASQNQLIAMKYISRPSGPQEIPDAGSEDAQ